MRELYEFLGMETLIDNAAESEKLRAYIMEKVRFLTPGYWMNYLLRTHPCGLDFILCKDQNGIVRGTDIQLCGRDAMTLTLDNIISSSGTTHHYSMRALEEDDAFPVRVVSPDVLAAPKPGDQIYGQIAAFLNDVDIMNNAGPQTGSVQKKDERSIWLSGIIEDICPRRFTFGELDISLWEMEIRTSIGQVSALARAKNLAVPQVGQFLRAEAILSLDVGCKPHRFQDSPYSKETYKELRYSFPPPERINIGLVPNRKNAQRVLMACIAEHNFSRFERCCSYAIKICSAGEEYWVWVDELSNVLASLVGSPDSMCSLCHIVSSDEPELLGSSVVAIEKQGTLTAVVYLGINSLGYVDKIRVISPGSCQLGIDPELHVISELAKGMCSREPVPLRELLAPKCIYTSHGADKQFVGASAVLAHLSETAEKLSEQNGYTFELIPAKEELSICEDLPEACLGRWCVRLHQAGKPAAVMFVQVNQDGEAVNILLSKDGSYLRTFEKYANRLPTRKSAAVNVRSELEEYYGSNDTVRLMREDHTSSELSGDLYIWGQADLFAVSWLENKGYTVRDTRVYSDCIGYLCVHEKEEYAVYLFACGTYETAHIDAAYCQRLRRYPLSENRPILVVYMNVDKRVNEDSGIEYHVGHYRYPNTEPELWILERIDGKDMLVYFARKSIYEAPARFIAAFNAQDLDVLQYLCSKNACLEEFNGRNFMNDGFYSRLPSMYRTYGTMKLGYIRYGDRTYSRTAYLGEYCTLCLSITGNNKISSIRLDALCKDYRELHIADNITQEHPLNTIPKLLDVAFLPPSSETRFAMWLRFEDGERKYTLQADPNNDFFPHEQHRLVYDLQANEIVTIDGFCFTDKIFRHGKLTEHLPLPDWMGYRNYPKRRQGIEFANGYCISAVQLYFDSKPVEEV